MILRLFRGRAAADREAEVATALAGAFADRARSLPGVTSYVGGLRVEAGVVRFVVASTWQTIEDVVRQTRGPLDRPAAPLLDFMAMESVDHYELVGDVVPIIAGPNVGIVRVARMRIRIGSEDDFYAVVRRGLEGPAERGDLLAYHLGRRVTDAGHEAAAVSVWRSERALGRIVEPESREPLWAAQLRPLLDAFEVEHYEAVPPDAAEPEA